MKNLTAAKQVQFVAADAVEHGLRNVLTGKPHQMLKNIEINGSAEHKASFTEGGERKKFANKGTESELTLQAVVGMIDYYRRNNESVAFEGAAFTPEWIKKLDLEGFEICAAFVGYTDSSHADKIITHAKKNPDDWINTWLQKSDGEEEIREWIENQVKNCKKLKKEAEDNGYPFFDIASMAFEEYITYTQQYFLKL